MGNQVLGEGDLAVVQKSAAELLSVGDKLGLRNKRLLISGGTGFLGRWVVESLCMLNDRLELNNQIYLVTRSVNRTSGSVSFAGRPDVHFIQSDVRDVGSIDLPGCHFVIHAATDVASNTTPLEVFDTCVDGTRAMLRLAKKMGAEKFLLFSSGAVYGNSPLAPARYREDYLGAPRADEAGAGYASGKRAAEYIASAFCDENDIRLAIARCFAFTGPGIPLGGPFALSDFISGALSRSRRISIAGDGSTVRSYMYATDLVDWILRMLVSEEPRLTLNVGGEQELSMREVAEIVSTSFDYQVDIFIKNDPSVASSTYLPDVSKALSIDGFRLRYDSYSAVAETVRTFI